MAISEGTYLEALLLLMGSNTERSRALVDEFLKLDEKTSKKLEMIGDTDPLIPVYRSLIRTIMSEGIDLSVDPENPNSNDGVRKALLLKISVPLVAPNHMM